MIIFRTENFFYAKKNFSAFSLTAIKNFAKVYNKILFERRIVVFKDLTRRDFIKATSMTALAMTVPMNVFAADNCTVKTRYGTFNGFVDKQGDRKSVV